MLCFSKGNSGIIGPDSISDDEIRKCRLLTRRNLGFLNEIRNVKGVTEYDRQNKADRVENIINKALYFWVFFRKMNTVEYQIKILFSVKDKIGIHNKISIFSVSNQALNFLSVTSFFKPDEEFEFSLLSNSIYDHYLARLANYKG